MVSGGVDGPLAKVPMSLDAQEGAEPLMTWCENKWVHLGLHQSVCRETGCQARWKFSSKCSPPFSELSAMHFNTAIIFRTSASSPPAEPQIQMPRHIMIPANSADRLKELQIANNSFATVHLPPNVRKQNNNLWVGGEDYWLGYDKRELQDILTAALYQVGRS